MKLITKQTNKHISNVLHNKGNLLQYCLVIISRIKNKINAFQINDIFIRIFLHTPVSMKTFKLSIIKISSLAVIFFNICLYFSTESLCELLLPTRACSSILTTSAIFSKQFRKLKSYSSELTSQPPLLEKEAELTSNNNQSNSITSIVHSSIHHFGIMFSFFCEQFCKMSSFIMEKTARLTLGFSKSIFYNVCCSRWATTSGAAASTMMKSYGGKNEPEIRNGYSQWKCYVQLISKPFSLLLCYRW